LDGLPISSGEAVFQAEVAQPSGNVVGVVGIRVMVAFQTDDGPVVKLDIKLGSSEDGRGEEHRGQGNVNESYFHGKDIKRMTCETKAVKDKCCW
jgi:hypothetical protein